MSDLEERPRSTDGASAVGRPVESSGTTDHERRAELIQLRKELDRQSALNRQLLASNSWRLTRPLRTVRRWLARARGGDKGQEAVADIPAPLPMPAHLTRFDVASEDSSNQIYRPLDARDATASLEQIPSSRSRKYRVGFIGSRELAEELNLDCEVRIISEAQWQADLAAQPLDYVMLEPVWADGVGAWRHSLLDDGREKSKLVALLEHCRNLGIPSVLWFREDLTNYPRFSWLAGHVSRVYSVDERSVKSFRTDFPLVPSGILDVAVQPKIHNPVKTYSLFEAAKTLDWRILFDGWWELYSNRDARELLTPFRSDGLVLCEREWEFGQVRLKDVPEFASRTVGCVDSLAKAALNKLLGVELFMDCKHRLPWRQRQEMMRAAACGALVAAIENDGMQVASVPGSAFSGAAAEVSGWVRDVLADPVKRSRLSHELRRELLSTHCLVDRLDSIAVDLCLENAQVEESPGVAAILVTMRPQLLVQCIDRFRADRYQNKELIVILHGEQDLEAARSLIREGERIRIFQLGIERSLGACLNFAIDLSESEYWSKFDDDDLYGPNYLSDVMLARRMGDFDVMGKPIVFTYLEGSDALFRDPVWAAHEQLWHAAGEARSAMIAGATLTVKKAVWEKVKFSEKRRGGSDSDFIRRCYEAGFGVLALDGFNFACYRSSKSGFHTWAMDESQLGARGQRLGTSADMNRLVFI